MKEPYIKPEVKSEKLKPEVLANPGSPAGETGENPYSGC